MEITSTLQKGSGELSIHHLFSGCWSIDFVDCWLVFSGTKGSLFTLIGVNYAMLWSRCSIHPAMNPISPDINLFQSVSNWTWELPTASRTSQETNATFPHKLVCWPPRCKKLASLLISLLKIYKICRLAEQVHETGTGNSSDPFQGGIYNLQLISTTLRKVACFMRLPALVTTCVYLYSI